MAHHYLEDVLISRLQNREEMALGELYDRYSVNLYGVILRIVKQEMLAEEVMQDCFVKIWSSFPSYDSGKGRLYTWLVTLARHVAIDKCRSRSYRQSRLNQDLDVLLDNNKFESSAIKLEHIGLKELLAILPVDQRKVVDLLYFEGYSHVEAAKVLAIPLGTVKTRVRHALQILRKLMVEPVVSVA